MLTAVTLASLLGPLALAHSAHADTPPRRAVPRYRSRPLPGPPGDAALWVPRAILMPLRGAFELLVRQPTRAIGWPIEQRQGAVAIRGVFHPTRDFRWLPFVNVDVGMATTAGAYASWDHALVRPHQLRVDLATGGAGVWLARGQSRWDLSGGAYAGVRGVYDERNDHIYVAREDTNPATPFARFRLARAVAQGFAGFAGRHGSVEFALGYRADDVGEGRVPFTPPPPQGSAMPPLVPGVWHTASVAFSADTRAPNTFVRTGLFVQGAVSYQGDASSAFARAYLTTWLEAGATLNVAEPGSAFELTVYAARVDPLTAAPVPLADTVTLGGRRMRGFLPGRLRGESAVVGTLTYHQPFMHLFEFVPWVSAGNAFGVGFEGFGFAQLRAEAGAGVTARIFPSVRLEVGAGMGTTRFDQRFGIESGRFYAGVVRQF